MGKYEISGNKGNRERTRKDTKKDISTSSFNNLHWYYNRDRIWLAEPKIQYATMMLYRMKNRDDNRKIKQVEEEQDQNQFRNTFYQKVQKIAKYLQTDICDVSSTSKSKWEKR